MENEWHFKQQLNAFQKLCKYAGQSFNLQLEFVMIKHFPNPVTECWARIVLIGSFLIWNTIFSIQYTEMHLQMHFDSVDRDCDCLSIEHGSNDCGWYQPVFSLLFVIEISCSSDFMMKIFDFIFDIMNSQKCKNWSSFYVSRLHTNQKSAFVNWLRILENRKTKQIFCQWKHLLVESFFEQQI